MSFERGRSHRKCVGESRWGAQHEDRAIVVRTDYLPFLLFLIFASKDPYRGWLPPGFATYRQGPFYNSVQERADIVENGSEGPLSYDDVD